MSADNCIAILQTTDKFEVIDINYKKNMFREGITAYRVAHIQDHDNYAWYKENEIHNLGCWFNDLFKNSKVFYSSQEASEKAIELLKEIEYTEYGIINIDASDYNFPGH